PRLRRPVLYPTELRAHAPIVALPTSLRAIRSFHADVPLAVVDRDAHHPRVATDFTVLDEAVANVLLDIDFDALAAVGAGDPKYIVHKKFQVCGLPLAGQRVAVGALEGVGAISQKPQIAQQPIVQRVDPGVDRERLPARPGFLH